MLQNKKYIEEIIRVNHAGEYGAKMIYQGQMDILKNSTIFSQIKHMSEQEEEHLKFFQQQLKQRKIRPTALIPFWHISGYCLGVATALLGKKTAMNCTEYIEEVIDQHYAKQIERLDDSEQDLKNKIIKFRNEEIEHKNIAEAHDMTGGNFILKTIINLSCKLSIAIAKKL